VKEEENMADISVTIPIELTQAMVIRGGVIRNEARALEFANELHEIVAELVKPYRASKTRLVKLDDNDPDAEPTVLEELREPNALELADFTLAVWRQALVDGRSDTPDSEEAAWISVKLTAICDDDLYWRWIRLGDVITGSDVASLTLEAEIEDIVQAVTPVGKVLGRQGVNHYAAKLEAKGFTATAARNMVEVLPALSQAMRKGQKS
jgi:hypothetical protein